MKNLLFLTMVIAICSCKKKDDPVAPPSTPVATAATDITNEAFSATWNSSTGANDYELDVATDASFSNIVDAQKNLAAGGTNVSELTSNMEYFYRVRGTINGANPSANSNTISTTTLPDAPLALGASNNTSSSFTANWQALSGITTYLLYVSKDNFPANPPNNVSGYDGLEVTGTSHDVINLEAGTIYYYILKAKGAAHNSVESSSILTQTSN